MTDNDVFTWNPGDLETGAAVIPDNAQDAAPPGPSDPASAAMATAHRLGDVLHHLARASQRMQAAREATSPQQRAVHSGHVARHLKHALKAGHGLTDSIREHYPAEAAELEKVKDATGLAGITGQMIALTGDGHGRHIPGTPDVYSHGWHPLNGTETGMDGIRRPGKKTAGKVPPAERAPSVPASPADVIGQYKGWRDGLTGDEDKAVRFYQSPGFALMNGQLRGLDPEKLKAGEHASDADLKRARKAVKDLKSAIAKAPPLKQDTTVFRGFDAGQFGELEPGKVVTDKGFMSTALTNDAGAVGRAKSPGQMTLKLPAGTKAAAGTARELILPPGSSVRVTGVTKKGAVTHVTAELVPPGSSHAGEDDGAVLLAKAVSDDAKAATTAHLLETTLHELAHARRHAQAMKQDTPDEEWQFNREHAAKHLAGAAEHAGKLAAHFTDNYPGVAKWLNGLGEVTVPGGEDGGEQHARYAKGGGETIGEPAAKGETITGQAAR